MLMTAVSIMPPGFELFMFDNLTTAVLLFDSELRLTAMNPAAEALLDLSAKKMRGMNVGQLFPGAGVYTGALTRVVKGGHPCTEREMQLRLPGARVITVDCTVTPVNDPNQPAGVLVELIALDRHKRISREEQLLIQNETARALVRGLAHEIKNPLSGLRGAAQLLARELFDESLHEYTNIIIREADRLQKLLDRMLGPCTPPQMRRLNIHEVSERVRALIRAEAPEGVSVYRDYDPSIPEVYADPELLIQATLNVARNAVQSVGEEGRITLRTRIYRHFTIRHRLHRLVVCIAVSDNGPGIPPELRETIFYPMVSGRPEGTGLGLSIAQSLVYQHGGLIECQSVPGETTFSILLPVENGQ